MAHERIRMLCVLALYDGASRAFLLALYVRIDLRGNDFSIVALNEATKYIGLLGGDIRTLGLSQRFARSKQYNMCEGRKHSGISG